MMNARIVVTPLTLTNLELSEMIEPEMFDLNFFRERLADPDQIGDVQRLNRAGPLSQDRRLRDHASRATSSTVLHCNGRK